jgi:ubiquinone/menaquinone biosynthesis C-methylase UbiE
MKIRFEKTMMAIPEEKVSVLDIGCGPGHYCFSLAQKGSREILGIDFSEAMIQLASNHAKELGLGDNVKFNVVNFFSFEPENKFDYSIMMGFIEYFERPDLIIEKAVKVTNRKILISFPVAGGFLAFQRKIRYRSRCYLRLYSFEDIKKLMADLNIKSYTIELIQRDFFVTVNLN